MQRIYGDDRIEVIRMRNFLAQHGVEAELRESTGDSPDSLELATEVALWVAESDVTLAEALRDEFLALSWHSSDEDSSGDEAAGSAPGNEDAPFDRRRVPWLTLLFAASSIFLCVRMWREPAADSADPFLRWGWRHPLDVASGSWWAIFPSTLLHMDVEHLVLNLLGIIPLGAGIERACGRVRWLGLFVSAVIASAAGELAARGQLGCGASGIWCAFFSFALIASFQRRILPGWLMILFTLWALSFTIFDVASALQRFIYGSPDFPFTGYYAHLAGLAIGALYAGATVVPWKPWLLRTAFVAALAAAIIPLRGSPWLASWHLERAGRAVAEHRVEAAIEDFTRAIELDPKSAIVYVQRGYEFLADGRFDEALSDFETAAVRDPGTPEVDAYRSSVFVLRSEFPQALEAAEQSIKARGAGAFAYNARGSVLFSLGKIDAAIRDFTTSIEREPREVAYWTNRASARMEQLQCDAGFADADHAVWLNSQDGNAHLLRGIIGMQIARDEKGRERAKSDIRRAHELLSKTLELSPRDIWLRCALADAATKMSIFDEGSHWLQGALGHAEQAVVIAPRYWFAYSARAGIKLARQEFESAERDASRALELNSEDYGSASLRGASRLKLRRPTEAVEDFERALKINSRFGDAWLGLARARLDLGQTDEAIVALNTVIELNPRLAEAYELRGNARASAGQREAGMADLRAARELDSRFETEGSAAE